MTDHSDGKSVRDVLDDLSTGSVSNLTTDMAIADIKAAMPSEDEICNKLLECEAYPCSQEETEQAINKLIMSKFE